jgi:hypothetical protein
MTRLTRQISPVLLVCALLLVGCTEPSDTTEGDDISTSQPVWVEAVYPEPGATVAVPDAVEVDHTITSGDEDVRLIVNGTDVTTYATFDAGKVRYESGDGPVVLGDGVHQAEVLRVTLPTEGVEFTVLDRFSWEFRTG